MTTPEQVLHALEKQPDLLLGVIELLVAQGLVLPKPPVPSIIKEFLASRDFALLPQVARALTEAPDRVGLVIAEARAQWDACPPTRETALNLRAFLERVYPLTTAVSAQRALDLSVAVDVFLTANPAPQAQPAPGWWTQPRRPEMCPVCHEPSHSHDCR